MSSKHPIVRVGRVLHGTTAEGPGLRTAVWVQGCTIRCQGCINPQLFNKSGGEAIHPEAIVRDALEARVEGLTLLGGEPFDQAAACSKLAHLAQEAGLGVICFTGYTHEALVEIPSAQSFLEAIDLLVDGPYIEELLESRRALVGSSNQRFIHLTNRYTHYDPHRARNRLDISIRGDGSIRAAGFLSESDLSQLVSSLEVRRTPRRGWLEGRETRIPESQGPSL